MANKKLTGNFYHRKGFCGMVLWVEVEVRHLNVSGPMGLFNYTEVKYKRANEREAVELIRLIENKKIV